ncbi:MAG TPA: O-antigen ligase family protein [Candidatus Udaeobacter sp.]|nr:O-antigen ligase family protein [Candidatus Udaeobacter sp.]
MQQFQSRENQKSAATTRWMANATVALLPVLACFLGGATQKWEEGLVITVLATYLLMRPPRFSLGALTNVVLLTLFILAAVAFLPARWFFQPEWRAALVNDFGIQLPSALTPQPWITLSYFVSFVAGLSWLYIVSTQDLELHEVRFQLRLFTGGIALLAAICIALDLARTTLPFWHNEENFGPFPNRNQTADLFGLTAIVILACAQDDLRKRRKRWIVWILALVLIGAAIILNFSRSGIVILVAGSAFWLGALAFRQRSPWRLALGISLLLLLLLLTALLLFGGQTFERFHLRDFITADASTNFRWQIFHDTFRLIRNSPWCGIGFGNFESIFAIFRDASLGDPRALHPGSDWLWLWTELGWPAVVLTIVGIAMFVSRVFPLRVGTNQGYRLAALIAAGLFAIHGIVDVSGHQVGTAFAAIFLLGLSLHRPLCLKRSQWTSILFRFVGLVLLAAGLSLVVAARSAKLLPGSVGVYSAKQLSEVANREGNYSETIALTTGALRWAPIDWQLYLARAIGEVELKQTTNAVDDFRRARFLEPIGYEVPLAEGNAWLRYRPMLTMTAWREALHRAGPLRPEVYANMLSDASLSSPEVSPFLEEIGLSEHDLALPYLDRLSNASFNRALAQLLKNDPNLQSFSETEKLALFAFWSERGDPEEISRGVEQHPEWLRYAWLGMANHNARRNDFRAAYELTQQYGEPVALPRVATNFSLQDLENRLAVAPNNYGLGYELYRAQMQSGRVDDALLTARHFSERSNSPAYFHFLEAQCWAEKQNWESAWNAWQAFHAAQVPATK